VDLLPTTHDFSVSSLHPICVAPNIPVKHSVTLKHLIANPNTSVPGHGAATENVFGPSSKAPYMESWVDACLPSGLFEKSPYTGFGTCISGTYVFPLSQSSYTCQKYYGSQNRYAGDQSGKAIQWLRIFMGDIVIPFGGPNPIPVAEDNAATCIIAHTGKLTRNIPHVALKTLYLQALVRRRLALFRTIGSARNKADHFTKYLALPARQEHCSYLTGVEHNLYIRYNHCCSVTIA
jgi:hypothetical protein